MALIAFNLQVEDSHLPRIREALCAYIGFTAPEDVTNPHARQGLARLVKNTVHAYERNQAAAAAEAAVDPEPDVQ